MRRRLFGRVLLMLEVEVNQLIAMNAVERQYDHHREIGDEQQGVEGVPAVEVFEGLVAVVGAEVVLQAVRSGQPKGERVEAV